VQKTVTISGRMGDDAKPYQIRAARLALLEVRKWKTAPGM
jgi:hypothetical protein